MFCPVSAGQPSHFFLRGQEKVTKKKAARRLVGIYNSNALRVENKTGTRKLARCFALNRAQTNARYDPVLLSMLGIVSREQAAAG